MSRPDFKTPVRECIQRLLFQITELEAIVSDFQGDNELLQTKLNEYLAELAKLQGLRDSLSPGGVPIEVPIELLRYVDDGGNPDVFTVDAIKASVAANQISKGKAEAFRQLKDRTTQKLKEAFPEDVTDYQQLRQEVVQGGGAQGPSGG